MKSINKKFAKSKALKKKSKYSHHWDEKWGAGDNGEEFDKYKKL